MADEVWPCRVERDRETERHDTDTERGEVESSGAWRTVADGKSGRGVHPDGRGRTMAGWPELSGSCLLSPAVARLGMCAGAICAAPRTEGTLQTRRERDTWSGARLFAGPVTTKRERAEMAKLRGRRGPVCFDTLLLGRRVGGTAKWTNHIARTR